MQKPLFDKFTHRQDLKVSFKPNGLRKVQLTTYNLDVGESRLHISEATLILCKALTKIPR